MSSTSSSEPLPVSMSMKELCIVTLKEMAEEAREKNTRLIFDGDSLIDIKVLGDDMVEYTHLSCGDHSIILKSKISGALSRAISMGGENYTRFLEALVKSRIGGPVLGEITIDDNIVTLTLINPYCEVNEAVDMARRDGSDLNHKTAIKDLITIHYLSKAIFALWIKRVHEALAKGEKPEPLDLEEALETVIKSSPEERDMRINPDDTLFQ